jgi:nicotinate-nucleotide pyrophosphorylase (carboxylating)
MDDPHLAEYLELMLREDVGEGDITSAFTPNRPVRALITANSDGYVSGIHELKLLFKNHGILAMAHVADGGKIRFGQKIFTLEALSRDLLPVERTALNLISRMSAVTTLTRKYADALRRRKSRSKIVATRKTTPLLRYLEKTAVVAGGGLPHRMGLYDMILIKDNHLMLFQGDVRAAVEAAKASGIDSRIEVEVASAQDALAAAEAGADMVMFDNMQPKDIRLAIALLKKARLRGKVLLEISGGITLENLGRYSGLGADWISTGKITHSAPNVDFTMSVLEPAA